MFPWFQQKTAQTPVETMLQRLREGVPPELATRAAGVEWDAIKDDPEVVKATAEGEIILFERARDGGVSGSVRAALRYETRSWSTTAEPNLSGSLEDLLRD